LESPRLNRTYSRAASIVLTSHLRAQHTPHSTTTKMHDPFPIPRPESLVKYVEPVAEYLSLKTLPLHFHEVAAAFTLYHVTYRYISPAFSRFFFPRIYSSFNARPKLNWDVHIVSFVQSTLICGLALWVMWTDSELNQMDGTERVHGYTGASGLIQAFAGGYFLWDLAITVQNVKIFGIGMLFHAISALCVFSLGFVSIPRYIRHGGKWNTDFSPATIRKLLRMYLYPLRTFLALPEHPLVLR
jgi:hypothetical protein